MLFYLKMKNVFLLESSNGFMKLKIFQLHYQKIFESELKLNFDLFVFLVSSDNYARMLLVQWRKIQHWKRRLIQKHIEDQNDRPSKKLESLRKLINNIKLKVFLHFISKAIFSPIYQRNISSPFDLKVFRLKNRLLWKIPFYERALLCP